MWALGPPATDGGYSPAHSAAVQEEPPFQRQEERAAGSLEGRKGKQIKSEFIHVLQDAAGYSSIQQDAAVYSRMQQDTAGYSSIQQV